MGGELNRVTPKKKKGSAGRAAWRGPQSGRPDSSPPCWNLAGGTLGQGPHCTPPHPHLPGGFVAAPGEMPCFPAGIPRFQRERVEGGQGVGLSTQAWPEEREVAPSVAREVCSGSGSHPGSQSFPAFLLIALFGHLLLLFCR